MIIHFLAKVNLQLAIGAPALPMVSRQKAEILDLEGLNKSVEYTQIIELIIKKWVQI